MLKQWCALTELRGKRPFFVGRKQGGITIDPVKIPVARYQDRAIWLRQHRRLRQQRIIKGKWIVDKTSRRVGQIKAKDIYRLLALYRSRQN